MTLVDALIRTYDFLGNSQDSDWTPWSVAEIRSDLLGAIVAIQSGKTFDHTKIEILFAPTGAVQETSMSNGWSEEMLRLGEIIDKTLYPKQG